MNYDQNWQARALRPEGASEWFDAQVPGNVQYDYGRMMGWGDINFGDNVTRFRATEDDSWEYRTILRFDEGQGERAYMVFEGVDYLFDIFLDGEQVRSHEGMYSRVEVDVTGRAGSELRVLIHPHPKRPGASESREQADQSAKPPVCYEWDWHPRMLVSGLWREAYVQTRGSAFIRRCEPFYQLNDALTRAEIRFEVDCDATPEIILYDPDGIEVGRGARIHLDNPRLWWCNGQGEQALYRYVARTDDCETSGWIGLRKVRLVMNEGAWDEPADFPKGRSNAPIQLELNGRRVFAKGSNWVNPDIYNGRIDAARYEQLIALARDANMNILRCWGGSGINKPAFYELCDQMGIMVWAEFPLACNNYRGTPHYLRVLEQEAASIIRSLRKHASVVLWCGGNELFNAWSGMTDQSLALRLLNKLCYELDRDRPFLMTSPLTGMGHGGYTFYDPQADCDVFTLLQRSHFTAYTEFGVPGMPDADEIRQFIPEEEWFPIRRDGNWRLHHAFGAWGEERWLCMDVLNRYADAPLDTLEDVVEMSQWLQCEGYRAIFEEARRQAPYCSMAINWCYCEPWKTAANNSLIAYPTTPKKAYAAVQSALRPVLASARIPRFDWRAGDCFTAELWLLNDSPVPTRQKVAVSIEFDGEEYPLLVWDTGEVKANENRIGPAVNWMLPEGGKSRFTLKLDAGNGASSAYTLCYHTKKQKAEKRQMNM
ncbi:MAG: glycoside hydrolase family 2 protein [Christensenellales bacterium]